MVAPSRRRTSALPTPHTQPSRWSTSRARWSRWSWALAGYFPVTTSTRPPCRRTAPPPPAPPPPPGRVGGPHQRRDVRDRVLGVQRAEPVAGRGDRVRGEV